MKNSDHGIGGRNTGAAQPLPGDPRRFDVLIAVEMTFDGMPCMQVKHHDVGKLVGHAFGRVKLPHMVEFDTVTPGGLHTGFLTKLPQRGLFNVRSPVDESGRQTIGEGVATDTIFAFDQVPVVRAIMH